MQSNEIIEKEEDKRKRSARLVADLRVILQSCHHEDGITQMSTLDYELLERSLHAIDLTYLPMRPDKAVDPCPHGCDWCKRNDTPSS